MRECVACRKSYTGNNHHCDPVWEARAEGARKAHTGVHKEIRDYVNRLSQGFLLLNLDGNCDVNFVTDRP